MVFNFMLYKIPLSSGFACDNGNVGEETMVCQISSHAPAFPNISSGSIVSNYKQLFIGCCS